MNQFQLSEQESEDKERFENLLSDIEMLKYKNANKFQTYKYKDLHSKMFEMFDKMILYGHQKI
jgi:hypothetical protein